MNGNRNMSDNINFFPVAVSDYHYPGILPKWCPDFPLPFLYFKGKIRSDYLLLG